MVEESVEGRIKRVIVRSLSLDIRPEEIGDEEQLFEGSLSLDSEATIQIIVGLEEEFDIEFEDEDLRPELFDSVWAMAQHVRSALSSAPSEGKGEPPS